jgi:hypothetical protein
MQGAFDISGLGQKSGPITGGHITLSRYSLTGTETTDTFCAGFGGGLPTTVSIQGKCGDNVLIEFRAANGERRTFVGNVDCFKASN